MHEAKGSRLQRGCRLDSSVIQAPVSAKTQSLSEVGVTSSFPHAILLQH